MSDGSNIDHVGIAVKSLRDAVPLYRALLGTGPSGREEIEGEGVRLAFFGEGPGRVELLEPTADDTPVGRFLERDGGGIHHVCVRVGDVEEAVRRAVEAGAELLPPGIRRGAGGRPVAFLHPRSTGGVLLEVAPAT